MVPTRRKFLHSLLAFAVLAFSSLVSFHAHTDEAGPVKASDHCATCLSGGQLRSAGPAVPAAGILAPVFDHYHLTSIVQASFIERFSGPRPARAPPIS